MWEAHGTSTAGPQESPCRRSRPCTGPLTVFLGRRLGSRTLTRTQVPFPRGFSPPLQAPLLAPSCQGSSHALQGEQGMLWVNNAEPAALIGFEEAATLST